MFVFVYPVARQGADFAVLAGQLEAASGTLLLWRTGLIATFVALWPTTVAWLGRRRGLDRGQIAMLVRARWRLALSLVVFELAIVQGTVVQGLAVLIA